MLIFRPTMLNCDISALGISGFAETLSEGSQTAGKEGRRFSAKISDHRQRRLLCPHRERPCDRRAAEKGNKLAPLHVPPENTLSAMPKA